MPGMTKTVSTTIEPATMLRKTSPCSVATGISAFFSTCAATVCDSLKPLARAVRM